MSETVWLIWNMDTNAYLKADNGTPRLFPTENGAKMYAGRWKAVKGDAALWICAFEMSSPVGGGEVTGDVSGEVH